MVHWAGELVELAKMVVVDMSVMEWMVGRLGGSSGGGS